MRLPQFDPVSVFAGMSVAMVLPMFSWAIGIGAESWMYVIPMALYAGFAYLAHKRDSNHNEVMGVAE